MITKVICKQPVKNRQDLKPLDICNTAWKSNKESTSELGVCIVLGVFRGMIDGMDDIITLNMLLNQNYNHLNGVRKSFLKTILLMYS